MKRPALLFVAVLASSQVLATALAWWIEGRFMPTGTSFRGLPLSTLSLPLKRLSLFSCSEGNEYLSPAQCAEIRISGTQFEIEQDFNRDGKVDLAQTGVAQKRDGTDVGVVVISERDNPRKNQVLEVSANGLLVLTYYAETLVAYSCIECDVGYHIVWNASTRRYQLRDSTDND